MSYARPDSNFNRINDELARSRYAEQLYNERLAAEEAASLARGEVFIDIPLAEQEAMPLIRQAPRIARQAAQIARAPPSTLLRGARIVNKIFNFGFNRVLSGTNVQAGLVGLATISFLGNVAAQYRLDEYRKRKREREGYKILSSEGVKEVQPRGDESLSKYTEVPANPMKKLKQKIEEINPTPVKTQNPAMTITPKKITTKTSTPPPTIYVTPMPGGPDIPEPREPPQIIDQPVQPVHPSHRGRGRGRGERPIIPSTASPTMSPPLPPPTTTPPPTTQSTTTQQALTSQINRDRGLYMGSKPVRPIHGYRVPNDRPYNLVSWERGARAKALLMVQ